MTWVLYLYIVTAVAGKADVMKKWPMPSQIACETQRDKARVVQISGAPTITVEQATSIETRAEGPASTVVLVCVQEPK